MKDLIRKLQKNDLPFIDIIIEKSIRVDFFRLNRTNQKYEWIMEDEITRTQEKYRRIINKPTFGFCFVYLENKLQVGTIAFSKLEDTTYSFVKNIDKTIKKKDIVEIVLVYVDPANANIEIKRKLVNYIIQYLKQTFPNKYYILHSNNQNHIPVWREIFGNEREITIKNSEGENDYYIWMDKIENFAKNYKDELLVRVNHENQPIGALLKSEAHNDKSKIHREVSVGIFSKNKNEV